MPEAVLIRAKMLFEQRLVAPVVGKLAFFAAIQRSKILGINTPIALIAPLIIYLFPEAVDRGVIIKLLGCC